LSQRDRVAVGRSRPARSRIAVAVDVAGGDGERPEARRESRKAFPSRRPAVIEEDSRRCFRPGVRLARHPATRLRSEVARDTIARGAGDGCKSRPREKRQLLSGNGTRARLRRPRTSPLPRTRLIVAIAISLSGHPVRLQNGTAVQTFARGSRACEQREGPAFARRRGASRVMKEFPEAEYLNVRTFNFVLAARTAPSQIIQLVDDGVQLSAPAPATPLSGAAGSHGEIETRRAGRSFRCPAGFWLIMITGACSAASIDRKQIQQDERVGVPRTAAERDGSASSRRRARWKKHDDEGPRSAEGPRRTSADAFRRRWPPAR